jgi:hypothetical protein
VLGVATWAADNSDDPQERPHGDLVGEEAGAGALRPVPDEYVSLAGSVGHGEEAHYRENEPLARLLARYWHENPRRLTRILTDLEIWANVFPINWTRRTRGIEVPARNPGAHHSAPRCLLRLHEKANEAELDGEGIQAGWGLGATRWRVPRRDHTRGA